MPNYLNKVVYLTDAQYATLCANHNTTIGGHKYDANTLYITNTPGNASTVNGYTVEKDVPFDAVFTDTNKYHESGSWNGLTYTATSIGGAGTLDFTIQTGTSSTTVAAGNHGHGNITNDGKIGSDANKVAITTTGGLLTTASTMYASNTKLAINSSSAPTENLYVNGKVQFNIGSSDGTSNKNFIVQGSSRCLSFGGQGIQAYTTGTTAGNLYLQYNGGTLQIGTSDTDTATRDMYGQFDFKSSTGFNYSGISAGSDNANRNIWFSYNGKRGVPVYDDDFEYNPNTNVLTVGKLTITGGTTNSSIASSGTLTIANKTKALTISTTTAALTISSTNGAMTIGPTGTGALTVKTNSGAMSIETTSGNISLTSGDEISITSGTNKTISISSGNILTLNSATNTEIEFQKNGTTAWSFSADGTNIAPAITNTIDLGIAAAGTETNARRWGKLFVGTADAYGDYGKPVYWNAGVPEATFPVQYTTWTIASGETSTGAITKTGKYFADTYVIALVVTSGEANLNGPLTWTTAADTLTITTSSATSGAVSGYVLTARADSI